MGQRMPQEILNRTRGKTNSSKLCDWMIPQVAMEEVFRPDCCEIYKAYGKNEHLNAIAKKTGIDIKVP